MKETELAKELTEQIYSFLDICAMYETEPTVLKFAQHLKESYEWVILGTTYFENLGIEQLVVLIS